MSNVFLNRDVPEVNDLLDKIDSTEIYTTAEKQKLAELENYNDSLIKQDISALKAEQTTQNEGIADNSAKISHLENLLSGMTVSRLIDFENLETDMLVGGLTRIKAYANMRRCNAADNGTINAYYGDSNYKEDGSNGQVMVYVPRFYYRVEPLKLDPIGDSVGGYHVRKAIYSVSDFPMAGYKLHPAFINETGNEVDYFLYGAFEGCGYDVSESTYIKNDAQIIDFASSTGDKLSSIAGVKPASGLTQQLTRPNAETIANNRGDGWHAIGVKQAAAIQFLLMVEYGANSQVAIGQGVVSITDNTSYNCSSITGSTTLLGASSGMAASTTNEIGGTETVYDTNGKVSVSYRGIEDFWGNIWDFVYGMNIYGDGTMRGGVPYICNDFEYAESKNSGNYQSAGFTTVNGNGYISAFGYGGEKYDWLLVGSDLGGNANGIIGDYHYITSSLNGYRIALLGGRWAFGSNAGGFCWHLNDGVGTRTRHFGARLCYYPQS